MGTCFLSDYYQKMMALKERLKEARDVVLSNGKQNEVLQIAGLIRRFGHPHSLQQLQGNGQISCQICKFSITGIAFGCPSCNFFLHDTCLLTPPKIKHKSHPHELILFPSKPPAYVGDAYCDACYRNCPSFLYHCPACNFDLHPSCAGLPLSVQYQQKYPLYLNFNTSTSVLYCDVCKTAIPNKGWLYYNKNSGYNVHWACALSGQKFSVDDLQKRLRRCNVE